MYFTFGRTCVKFALAPHGLVGVRCVQCVHAYCVRVRGSSYRKETTRYGDSPTRTHPPMHTTSASTLACASYVRVGGGTGVGRPGVAGAGLGALANSHLRRQMGQVFLLCSHVLMHMRWK